jgi:hypothetical protein
MLPEDCRGENPLKRSIARGRVFPQFYSTDRRYGRLSLKAVALLPLLWSNADDPSIDHLAKTDIPGILQELEGQQLIKAYDTFRGRALQMLDWWEVHTPQWAWPSEFPPTEGWHDHLRYKLNAKEVFTLNWPPTSKVPAAKSVYFILEEGAEAVKIGVADSPEARLADLQAATPHKLTLIKVIKGGGFELERKLQQKFATSALGNEWFRITPELQSYIDSPPENSPEPSPENSPEPLTLFPLTTPRDTETEKETERGRGNSPERSGEKPSSPTTGFPDLEKEILDNLTKCFKREFGRVKAERPDEVLPREPAPRELAQLRDLAKELASKGGCPAEYIPAAFREAAGQGESKQKITYVRAILFDWLGLERNHLHE